MDAQDKSIHASRQAVDFLKAVCKSNPNNNELRIELVRNQRELSIYLRGTFQPEAALVEGEAALAVQESIVPTEGELNTYRSGLAECHTTVGNALRMLGRQTEAEKQLLQAIDCWSALPDSYFEGDAFRGDAQLGGFYYTSLSLAGILEDGDRLHDAFDAYQRSSELLAQAAGGTDDELILQLWFGWHQLVGGRILNRLRRYDEGAKVLREGLVTAMEIRRKYSESRPFDRLIAALHRLLSESYLALDQSDEAEKAIRLSLGGFQQLVDFEPARLEYNSDLGRGYFRLGQVLWRRGEHQEASAVFAQSLAIFEALAEQEPNESAVRFAIFLTTCPDRTKQDPARAAEILPSFPASHHVLGVTQYRAGQLSEAVESLNKAVEGSHGGGAFDWLFLAMAHWRLGHHAAARDCLARAEELADSPFHSRMFDFPYQLEELFSEARAVIEASNGSH